MRLFSRFHTSAQAAGLLRQTAPALAGAALLAAATYGPGIPNIGNTPPAQPDPALFEDAAIDITNATDQCIYSEIKYQGDRFYYSLGTPGLGSRVLMQNLDYKETYDRCRSRTGLAASFYAAYFPAQRKDPVSQDIYPALYDIVIDGHIHGLPHYKLDAHDPGLRAKRRTTIKTADDGSISFEEFKKLAP